MVGAARAEGAVLGSADGRRSGRAVEAARDVGGGRHVEDFADSAGESAAQRRIDGLHRRAFAVGGGQVQQRRQDGASGRDGQVKDEAQRRSAQIVKLRLADGRRDGQDVSDFRNVVLHQMHFRFDKSHVHVHADGRATGRKGPVQRLVERTDKSGILRETSGRNGRSGRPVKDFGHDVVSGLLGLFRHAVRHDVTGRPGLFDVAAERLDRLAVREPESRVAGGDTLQSAAFGRPVAGR